MNNCCESFQEDLEYLQNLLEWLLDNVPNLDDMVEIYDEGNE